VAIVTGAGGGIGAALAHRLAAGGARVVVADIDPAGAREVAEAIGAAAVPVAGDVADEQVIATMIERAESEFGPVDLYFAN
ncbi:SDR family NAD(P)-dependent oxidoreductase, partial [Acinetobacter baumannii]